MDIRISEAMERLSIRKIERKGTLGFTVVLEDDRIGGGETVADAYANACKPDAISVSMAA